METGGELSKGLRARKKERTRDRLAAAACDLVIERGYEATTVEDIAAAVEVSPRTLFRYFPTKEDVVAETFRSAGNLDKFAEVFAARPADEPLVTSLRLSARSLVDLIEAERAKTLMLARVLAAVPTLRARLADQQRHWRIELAVPIARRLGLDPSDGRPQMVAAITLAILSTAMDQWGASDGQVDIHKIVDCGFELLESGAGPRTESMAAAAMAGSR